MAGNAEGQGTGSAGSGDNLLAVNKDSAVGNCIIIFGGEIPVYECCLRGSRQGEEKKEHCGSIVQCPFGEKMLGKKYHANGS
jgi:hypothetical protein